jgi:hypothetical protein
MDPNDADVDNSSNQIVACSQVCKFWRKVSLNTPTLWTKIDLMHPLCEIFFVRSVSLPIHIKVTDGNAYHTVENILHAEWLKNNISRIHGLTIRGSRSTIDKTIASLSPVSPNLSTVDIRWLPIPGHPFPFFNYYARSVHNLTLWAVDTDLDVYTNLTQISFHSLCPSQRTLPLETLISLLERSSRLQSLHLAFMHLETDEVSVPPPVLELAFIRHLVLIGVVGVVDFLSRISIPACAPLLGHYHAEKKGVPPFENRKIFQIESAGRSLSAYVYDLDDFNRHNRSFTVVDDSLSGYGGCQLIVSAITSCLALSQVDIGAILVDTRLDETVGYCGGHPSVHTWLTILFALSKITLVLFYRDACGWLEGFLVALSPSPGSGQIPCPKLKHIELYPNTPDSVTPPVEIAQATVQMLEARARCGASHLWVLGMPFGDDETTTKLKSLVHYPTFWVSVIVYSELAFAPAVYIKLIVCCTIKGPGDSPDYDAVISLLKKRAA